VKAEVLQALGVEQQVGSERDVLAEQPDLPRGGIAGGREVTLLVELAVVEQVALGHHAAQGPLAHHDAVEQQPVGAQRRAHHLGGAQAGAGRDQVPQRVQHGILQCVLVKQV
jgi:hypothetical protein